MTPRQKAIELYNTMAMPESIYQEYKLAKECTFIAIDAVLEELLENALLERFNYWVKVKQELEKL